MSQTSFAMKDKPTPKHVLIVDDEAGIVYVFRRYFELHGFRVSVAYDGTSALALSEDDPVDALVTDFRMPGMNGQELVERLKQSAPRLPAVIVSGYSSEISVNHPDVRVIGKPVEPLYLVSCVNQLLDDADTVRGLQDPAAGH